MKSMRSFWRLYVSSLVCILWFTPLQVFGAVSLYTINHVDCTFNAFRVVNDQIVYRGHVELPQWGWGGIDIAVDERSNTAFVSFENDGYTGGKDIELVNTQTLQYTKITVEGTTNMTGLVFDSKRGHLLATERNTNLLYVLNWDPVDRTLRLEETIALEGIQYACDVTIADDKLYVSEYHYNNTPSYQHVCVYDLSGHFAYLGQVDMGSPVVSIDCSAADACLYGGAWYYGGSNLIKRGLNDPNWIAKNIGASITGVSADTETPGRVFITTYRDGGSVEMWDTANWGTDPNTPPDPNYTDKYDNTNTDGTTISNLAGICVAEDYKPPLIDIVKFDDVGQNGCVSPTSGDPNITCTIAIASKNNNHTNIWVVDYLPEGAEFVSASPVDAVYGYDSAAHTYTWYLSELDGYDPNNPPADPNTYFTLKVKVNGNSEPMGSLINEVTVESDSADNYAACKTPVCCWDTGVIYVDCFAAGSDAGTSWANAYTTLQKAIDRRNKDCGGDQIWVAAGTYKPGIQTTNTFLIPAGVSVYGGFAGWETSILQRNIPANPTILSGYISTTLRNTTVVTMGNNAILDGFIVKESGGSSSPGHGIYGKEVNFAVGSCIIEENQQYGLYADNCNISLTWCTIQNNGYNGVTHLGNDSNTIVIENCQISENDRNGIYTEYSIPTIRNNQISFNGADSSDTASYYGLYLFYPQTGYDIRNNTVVYNVKEGIGSADPNKYEDPNKSIIIYNCILWGNKDDSDEQLRGNIFPLYSCVWDPNNSSQTTPDANGNISCDPGFAIAYTGDPNFPLDVHLAYDSFCRDTGSLNLSYEGQVDIDNQNRVLCGRVDMGADEYVAVLNITTNTPYDAIQDAIDEASNGDEIVVYRGTYEESIDLSGKAITVRSSNPDNWDIVKATIITSDTDSTVYIYTGDSILKGFTITNTVNGDVTTICLFNTSSVISHCIVKDSAYDGIDCDSSWPLITNCIIEGNDAGIYCTTGTLATIKNCVIWNNGCGIFFHNDWSSVVKNCTIMNNNGYNLGIWSDSYTVTVTNSILWGNGNDLYGCSATYSCIEDGDSGTGNIDDDPYFAEENNYHLSNYSPCMDTGNNAAVDSGDKDIDGEDRIDGGGAPGAIVDMGADEYL